ncbi:MAG TPA: iron-sulfur cluster assembly scaffold protein [Candidatus Polarisedimenticolia bacterium]|nr:iron-sulfur cluster assembly scaffold protein [Candidatus Polarisedimenticolia bacterium]
MPGYSFADYTPQVLDHFENPRNLGEVEDPEAAGRAGNAACGDVMDLTLRVRDGRIEQARVRVTGCPAAIASASITTVLLTGLTLKEAARVTNPQVAAALGGLPRAKLHCSVLAEEAILAALESYQRRGPARTGS